MPQRLATSAKFGRKYFGKGRKTKKGTKGYEGEKTKHRNNYALSLLFPSRILRDGPPTQTRPYSNH